MRESSEPRSGPRRHESTGEVGANRMPSAAAVRRLLDDESRHVPARECRRRGCPYAVALREAGDDGRTAPSLVERSADYRKSSRPRHRQSERAVRRGLGTKERSSAAELLSTPRGGRRPEVRPGAARLFWWCVRRLRSGSFCWRLWPSMQTRRQRHQRWRRSTGQRLRMKASFLEDGAIGRVPDCSEHPGTQYGVGAEPAH